MSEPYEGIHSLVVSSIRLIATHHRVGLSLWKAQLSRGSAVIVNGVNTAYLTFSIQNVRLMYVNVLYDYW